MKKSDFKLLKKQNEFLYELKKLLWLNFCSEDFKDISKDSKSYHFELDKIKSKPFLVIKSDPEINFEPFKQLKNKGFSHDVEIIKLCQMLDIEIDEIPVTWTHRKDSKLNIFVDTFKMFFELIRIKFFD